MDIEKELLDQLLAGRDPGEVFTKDGLLDDLKKALSERILDAELDEHLDEERSYGRTNVDCRSTGIDHIQSWLVAAGSLHHCFSSVHPGGSGPCKSVIFLTGITVEAASPVSSAHRPMCHIFNGFECLQ